MSRKSNNTTQTPPKPTKWESTNSLFFLMSSLRPDFCHKWSSPMSNKKSRIKWTTYQMRISTGRPKAAWQVSRTKDNVDHAGHLLPQRLQNRGRWSRPKQLMTFQNSNWSIARQVTEIRDATEAGPHQRWNTSWLTASPLKAPTHTLPNNKPARKTAAHSRSTESATSQPPAAP